MQLTRPIAAMLLVCAPATFAGVIEGGAASDPGKQSDWPAIAHGADGSLCIAYVEWNDKDADRVLVRRRDASGAWGAPRELVDMAPAITTLRRWRRARVSRPYGRLRWTATSNCSPPT
ncbi:MAG: hypothetical protein R2729_22460 [Bryobacteraceae bacterium]